MSKQIQNVSLCLLIKNGGVWLAMKKRGLAAGKWNGYGGKPDKNDRTIEGTAIRETLEESGVKLKQENLKKVGVIDFFFLKKQEWDQRLHAYIVTEWEGDPVETEEMKPQFFPFADIPWAEMWPEDKLWLPRILKGEKIEGEIHFKDTEGNAQNVELRAVKNLF